MRHEWEMVFVEGVIQGHIFRFGAMSVGKIRKGEIIISLKNRSGTYDPLVWRPLRLSSRQRRGFESRSVMVAQLRDDMILVQDVTTVDGRLLLVSGYQVNKTMRERLRNFALKPGVKEPIQVKVAIGRD